MFVDFPFVQYHLRFISVQVLQIKPRSQTHQSVPVFIIPSPSLPRTAKVPLERSGPINKFVDVEAVASDTDSSSDCLEESNADANKYKLDSVIVADDAGDGSSIEWSASPPRIQADIERPPSLPHIRDSQAQDESADDMDVSSSPESVFKDSALPVPKELYSNRVHQGTPEEKRPSSPKLYRSVIIFCPLLYPVTETKILSPIELSDDEYPVLPPSLSEPKERLKPFLLCSPKTPSRRLHSTISQSDGLVSISPSPPKNLTSIVVNGRTYYASDDPTFTNLVLSPSSFLRGGVPARSVVTNPVSSQMDSPSSHPSSFLPDVVGVDHQVDEDSFDLCYPPESPKNTMSPIPAPSSSHGLSIEDYDNMDIDLPVNFRSIPALRIPSPDSPSNPLEGWIPTPQSSSTLESRMRPVLPTTSSSKTKNFPSKLERGMSPLKIPYGASPSPPHSLLSSPSHSNSDTSTVNTSPSKSSATGSPSSRLKGKDHLRFHPFSNSKRTTPTPSPLVTTPVKTLPKPSAAGKKHRDAIIHHALTDALLSPSIPPIGFDNSASSSPPRKSRKELICDALSENDLMDSGDSAGFEEQYHKPQDVVPFINNNLGENGVLNAEWIDPRFATSFRSVVDLPSVILLNPNLPVADESITNDDDYLLYCDMVLGITSSQERCICQTVNFVQSANIFNGARFDPTPPCVITWPTINNKIHLVLAEDHFFNAVFLTVGRVTELYIFSPKSFLVKDKAIRHIRGLRVHGLMQESQRLFACFGSLIGSSKFGCPVSEGIIDFCSNQRFDSDAWKDDPDNLSPLEPVFRLTALKHSLLYLRTYTSSGSLLVTGDTATPTWLLLSFSLLYSRPPGTYGTLCDLWHGYTVCMILTNIHCKNPLPFSRAVLIFDGRDSFVAAPAQLNQIGSCTYPLYKNSEEDPPTGCIVCVGYTAHTWQSSGSYKAPPLSLSLSLQFVVVLALPPGYDGPDLPKPISSRPFPKPIYNTPTRTKDFSGPPCRKPPRSKPSSEDAAGSSRISRHAKVDSDDDSPYLHAGGLKEGFEYHEDVMASKSNHNGR
ncbi:hypothetical protein F5876DRAFT_77385 [Lentinula aff. lateritia]|uniref:Uncharacterized protein n=1 Tax=Lentinula aff. lateritia TaxID=2804960 RepID=A0ACC1TYF5_9AGAR|nr:hypothetical protein F5876DRAFT_77385 [Lentinula aff. lateritia]